MKLFKSFIISILLIVVFAYQATAASTIQFRRGTAAAWISANPVLNQGEPAYETDTGRLKLGDGTTHYVSLAYYPTTYSEEWIQQAFTLTYYSSTQFKVTGSYASAFPTGIRVKAIVTAGTIYGTVTTAAAGGSPTVTTVTVTWDSGALDSGLSAISIGIFSPINTSVPPQFFVTTGVILPYGGSTAPTGWLLCYGQAVSRTTYANLFAVIGTSFGSGDGSNTFNMPDFRGRSPIGIDNMGGGAAGRVAAATSIGYSAGAESASFAHTHTTGDHILTTAEMPPHSHSFTLYYQYNQDEQSGAQLGTGQATATSYSVTTTTTGGNTAHNHGATGSSLTTTSLMNPYLGISYIIRY